MDVVVVGGGVTGCSCALALAAGGLRVRLLEAGEIACGASGRNGGFALRGGAPSYDAARERLGAGAARMLWTLSERALEQMERLADGALRTVGSLRLAADERELDALRREYDALRADGFAVDWTTRLEPPLDGLFKGGLVHPRDGELDPARWVRRLALHAAAAGAELCEGRRVQAGELDELGGRVVVLALDGSTATLAPELAQLVRSTRGQVLVTEPLPERRFNRPHYARDGFDYWQQLPDGRLLLGGRRDRRLEQEYSSVDETTALIQAELDDFAARLLGRPAAVTHRWAGFWGETPDRLPLAGRVPGRERLWVAGGYSGHGNVLGFACGALVAAAIRGEEPAELALFDPSRFAPGPRAYAAAGDDPAAQSGHQ